ncbi:MAG: glycosyltransferase, partial [Rhodothermales bacterium]
NCSSHIFGRCKKIIESFFIRWFDHVFVVSPSIENWYRENYKVCNISLVMNCPLLVKLPRSNYLREKFSIPDDHVIFIYQGIITKGRGVEIILDAVRAQEKKSVCVLLGYGALFEQYLKLSETDDHLLVHPAVEPAAILDITASADCGVSFMENSSLSQYFSLPNKLFEFGMAGLPVITSPTLDQSRYIEENKNGIVAENYDSCSLSRAFKKFLNHEEGYFLPEVKKTRKIYNWQNQEDVIQKVYTNIFKVNP